MVLGERTLTNRVANKFNRSLQHGKNIKFTILLILFVHFQRKIQLKIHRVDELMFFSVKDTADSFGL